MKIRCLFGQQKEAYEGEHAPDILLAWSEYDIEENPAGWEEAVREKKEALKDVMLAFREVEVEVDQDKLRRLLLHSPVVKGTIKEEP